MRKWATRFGVTATAGLVSGAVAGFAFSSCPVGGVCTEAFVFAFLGIGLLAVGGLGLWGVTVVSLVESPRTGPAEKTLAIAFSAMPFLAVIRFLAKGLSGGAFFRPDPTAVGLAVVGALGLIGVWVAVRTRFLSNRWAFAFWTVGIIGIGLGVYRFILGKGRWAAFWSEPWFPAVVLSLFGFGVVGLIGVWVSSLGLPPRTIRVMEVSAICLAAASILIGGSYVAVNAVVASRLRARWTTYVVDDGLVHSRVNSIAVTRDGAVWFGTQGGVSSFDGKEWTTYTQDDGLPHNEVWSIAVASNGVPWVATYYGGVSRFDGETWSTYNTGAGLADNRVVAVAVATDGALWFGTYGGGVSRFDGEAWTTYTTADGLAENRVEVIAAAPDGTVWFGTNQSGVSRFDGNEWTTYTTHDGLVDNHVWSIAVGPDAALWFGTRGGVSRYDGEAWTTYSTDDGLADDRVTEVVVAADGALWFGTWDGASRFDGAKWTTHTTRHGLAADHVLCIAVAPDGVLWFGTNGGVSRYLPPD